MKIVIHRDMEKSMRFKIQNYSKFHTLIRKKTFLYDGSNNDYFKGSGTFYMYISKRDDDNQKTIVSSLRKGDALGKQYKCPETAAKFQ